MENPEVLEKILMYTGLAGLVVFGVFTLFKGIIQKNIFASMNEKQSYGVIKLIIRGSLTIAIIGIVAWGYTEIKKNEAYKNAALISKRIKGTVVTQGGEPIQNAKVALKKNESIFHMSDVNGEFLLEVSGTGNKSFDLIITHPRYQNITKLAEVNFASTEINVPVGELPLKPVTEIEIPDPDPGTSTRKKEKTANGDMTEDYAPTKSKATITLLFDDEGTGCNLDVTIKIGSKYFTPQKNPVQLTGLNSGKQPYSISGIAYCPTGQCAVISGADAAAMYNLTGGDASLEEFYSFVNEIDVVNGETYYLFLDPMSCLVSIVNRETLNELKALNF